MSLRIPTSLKKEFKDGFNEYIRKMGKPVYAYLPPYEVSCPNCIWDNLHGKSSNIYNLNFKRPVNIFPASASQRIVYPAPFNVTTVSGVQYDPALPNPKILQTVQCPVCAGEGLLFQENKSCFVGVVTVGKPQTGAQPSDFIDLSPGRDGMQLTRIKTFAKHYAVCRDAEYFVIDGVKYKQEIPARLKGLGNDSITELYLSTVTYDDSSNTKFDLESRVNVQELGQVSDQAPIGNPTIPPSVPGDDVW